MKHLLHLVRADVRRFRILLGLWVLIVIAEAVFRAVRPAFADEIQLSMMFNLLAAVLFTTRWLGMALIVALVVQTHPLVGSDAFWMTRPISWRVLLSSKLVLLVMTLVAVPAVAELALMVACRMSMREALPIALQLILFQCLWLFIFMALSSVTRSLAQLSVVAGGVLIGLILLLNVTLAVMMRRMDDGPRMVDVVPRTEASAAGFVVMLLLTIATAFTLVTVQYRTRWVRRSVLTGAAGICVVLAEVLFWPSPGRLVPVPDWANRESAVQLTAETSRGEFRLSHDSSPLRPGNDWQLGVARLTVRGVEEGWLPTVTLKDGRITFDGTTVRTAGNGYATQTVVIAGKDSLNDGPHSAVERQVLGVSRLLESFPYPQAERGTPAIILADAEFRKRLGSQGTYHGSFQVDLDRLAVAGTLPLEAGATFHSRQRRLIIDQVIAQSRAASVRLRHFVSTSMFASELRPRLSFYLRNRNRSEAVAGSRHGGFGSLSTGMAVPMLIGASSFSTEGSSGFSIISDVIRFPVVSGGYASGPPLFEITPEWLSQAELVIVHTIPAGSVSRDVEIRGFEIAEAPPSRPPG
jgi:hypothetical protein